MIQRLKKIIAPLFLAGAVLLGSYTAANAEMTKPKFSPTITKTEKKGEYLINASLKDFPTTTSFDIKANCDVPLDFTPATSGAILPGRNIETRLIDNEDICFPISTPSASVEIFSQGRSLAKANTTLYQELNTLEAAIVAQDGWKTIFMLGYTSNDQTTLSLKEGYKSGNLTRGFYIEKFFGGVQTKDNGIISSHNTSVRDISNLFFNNSSGSVSEIEKTKEDAGIGLFATKDNLLGESAKKEWYDVSGTITLGLRYVDSTKIQNGTTTTSSTLPDGRYMELPVTISNTTTQNNSGYGIALGGQISKQITERISANLGLDYNTKTRDTKGTLSVSMTLF